MQRVGVAHASRASPSVEGRDTPKTMSGELERDLAAIARIQAVPTILRTIRETTGLRFTLISRVLPDRWVACAVHDEIDFGLKAGAELDVATTLCAEVRDSREPIVIDHASTDPIYCRHTTPKLYGFESYVAVPIHRRNGEYFGNVCGLDPLPRKLSDPKTLATLSLFSELISVQLDNEERHAIELDEHREAAKLREQFIAVLGHDVRNPLSSISTGTDLLLTRATDPRDRRTLERIRSSTSRIASLVDDLLDLARGRLGGGIKVEGAAAFDLATRLRHVVAEVQASNPNRAIDLSIDLTGTVRCDAKRIEQLLSNLLANAIEHGAPRTPIAVAVRRDDREFELRVINEGPTIPAEAIRSLFQPYFRGGQSGSTVGLGLGLYIVSEIAKAHGGTMSVASADDRTTFVFTMPQQAPDEDGPLSH